MNKQRFTEDTKKTIINEYSTDKSQTLSSLAKKYVCAVGTIRNILLKENIPIRSISEIQTKTKTFGQEDHKRFWDKVNKKTATECWEWTASKDYCGYGRFVFRDSLLSAHRVSWEIHNGKILNGFHVLHKCDNPGCVNPTHLFLGTHQDNMNDRGAKNRAKGGKRLGEKNGASRFKESDIIAIRALSKQGIKQKEIAQQFGTTQSVISAIINRKYWTHI